MTDTVLEAFFAAWARADLEGLGDLLTAQVVFSPVGGETLTGRRSVLQRFARLLAEETGHLLSFGPVTGTGDVVLCRWHRRGRCSDVHGLVVVELDGERIRFLDVYQKI